MGDFKNKFKNSESYKNITHVRTPMTPENMPRRIGLLLVGAAFIVAGIIVWVSSCSSKQQYELNSEITAETVAEETVTIETTTGSQN